MLFKDTAAAAFLLRLWLPLFIFLSLWLMILPLRAMVVWESMLSFFATAFFIWRRVPLLAAVFLAFTLASLRLSFVTLPEIITGRVAFQGQIRSLPELRGASKSLLVETNQGLFRVSTDAFAPVDYGDIVSVEGTAEVPSAYERHQGVAGSVRYAVVARISAAGNPVMKALYGIRGAFSARFDQMLTEPHAGLIKGLLLGDKSALDRRTAEDFKTVGLTHILAVSGYNVTVVAAFLFSILAFCGKRLKTIITALGIVAFVLIVGAPASAVRAGIFGLLTLYGLVLGRPKDTLAVLLFTAAAMLAVNPLYRFDLGFQLSFLATVGILFIGPRITATLNTIPVFLRESLALTAGAQIATLPLLLFQFKTLSVFSLPTNVLLLPLVPPAMFGGAVLVPLSFTPLGPAAALCVEALTAVMLAVTHAAAALPLASLTVSFSGFALALSLIVLAGFVWYITYRREAVTAP